MAANAYELDIQGLLIKLSAEGYAYINDLPIDFDYEGQLSRLGPLVSQYNGEIVRDIRPDPGISDEVITPYNTSELVPHTEWYEFSGIPPRYLALWCVRPAEGPGGETTLADGYRFLELFTDAEREKLFSEAREWRSQKTLEREGVYQTTHEPVLAKSSDRLVLRFSTLFLVPADPLTAHYIEAGGEFFKENHVTIRIGQGDILIWDNWRMLHARNGFSDRKRHLRRVLIAESGESDETFGNR